MGQTDDKHKLVVRPYTLEDYPHIALMWTNQRKNPPPIDVLGKSGIVVEHEGLIVCAVFIFHPASSMGMIEFQIANIKAKRKIRGEAMDLMIEKAIEICRKIGYKYIYTATDSDNNIKRLHKFGFKNKGTKQQHLFWGL